MLISRFPELTTVAALDRAIMRFVSLFMLSSNMSIMLPAAMAMALKSATTYSRASELSSMATR